MIPHLFFSQLVLLGLLLYALLSALKDGKVSKDEAIERLSRSSHWEWVAMVWFDLNHGGFPPDNMARIPPKSL